MTLIIWLTTFCTIGLVNSAVHRLRYDEVRKLAPILNEMNSRGCEPGANDLVFVLDRSGSVSDQSYQVCCKATRIRLFSSKVTGSLVKREGKLSARDYDNLQLALQSLVNMTRSFTIGSSSNDSHVGMVLFDDQSSVYFFLDTWLTNNDVANAIMSAVYTGGGTDIADAMNTAITQVFGMAGDRPNVPNVMIVITDGQDDTDVENQYSLGLTKNIKTYALGVGIDVDEQQLAKVTGDPNRVLLIDNYTEVASALNGISCALTTDACACTHPNIWLDISFLIDASASMTANGLAEILGTLMGIVLEMTMDRSIDRSTRAALTLYSSQNETQILADFSTFNDSFEMATMLNDISAQSINYTSTSNDANLLFGMQRAISVFDGPGRRPFARKVLVVVASYFSVGDQNDVMQAAAQFKSSYGVIVAVGHHRPESAPITGLCSFSTPGMCTIIEAGNNPEQSVGVIFQSFCTANCFCKKNDYQFTSGDTTNLEAFGECIHSVVAPASWNAARLICQNQQSLLTQIFTSDKMDFLTQLSLNVLGTDQAFVGLKYNGTMTPAGWYWETATEFIPIAGTPVDSLWNAGDPDRTRGDCVQLKQSGGFQLKLWSVDCASVYRSYHCEYSACDTDNFCPNALGRDERDFMHPLITR